MDRIFYFWKEIIGKNNIGEKPRNQALSKGTIPTSFLVWILSRSNRIYFPCLPRLSPRQNSVDKQKHKQKPLEERANFLQISISRRHGPGFRWIRIIRPFFLSIFISRRREGRETCNFFSFANFPGRKSDKNAGINFSTRPPTIPSDKLVAESGRKINERDKWTSHSQLQRPPLSWIALTSSPPTLVNSSYLVAPHHSFSFLPFQRNRANNCVYIEASILERIFFSKEIILTTLKRYILPNLFFIQRMFDRIKNNTFTFYVSLFLYFSKEF